MFCRANSVGACLVKPSADLTDALVAYISCIQNHAGSSVLGSVWQAHTDMHYALLRLTLSETGTVNWWDCLLVAGGSFQRPPVRGRYFCCNHCIHIACSCWRKHVMSCCPTAAQPAAAAYRAARAAATAGPNSSSSARHGSYAWHRCSTTCCW